MTNGISQRSSILLLIEDEATDAVLLQRAFRRIDLRASVDLIREGAAAVDYLLRQGRYVAKRSEPLPALVILDLKLPKVSGLEILAQARANEALKDIPIIVLSSSSQVEDKQRAFELGTTDYLTKPVSSSGFVEVARQIQHYWCLLVEPPAATARS